MDSFKIKKNIFIKPDFDAYRGAAYVQVSAIKMSDSTIIFNRVLKYEFVNNTYNTNVRPVVIVRRVDGCTGCCSDAIFNTDAEIPSQDIADDRISDDMKTALLAGKPRMTVTKHSMISAYHKDMINVLCKQYASILLAAKGYDLDDAEFVD